MVYLIRSKASPALRFREVFVGGADWLLSSHITWYGAPRTNLHTSLDPILEERAEKHLRIDLIDGAYLF